MLKKPPVGASPLLLVGSHFRQRAGAQNRIALGLSHATDRMYLSYSGGCHETTGCRDRLDHIRRRTSTENPRHTLRRLDRRPAFHRKPTPVLSILTEMLELVVMSCPAGLETLLAKRSGRSLAPPPSRHMKRRHAEPRKLCQASMNCRPNAQRQTTPTRRRKRRPNRRVEVCRR